MGLLRDPLSDVPEAPGHGADEGLRLLGIESYPYVGNNPVRFSDPTGESALVAAGIVLTAVAAAGGLYLLDKCLDKCLEDPEEFLDDPLADAGDGEPNQCPVSGDPDMASTQEPRDRGQCISKCAGNLGDLIGFATGPITSIAEAIGSAIGRLIGP